MNAKQSQEQRLLEAALALETAAERQVFLASLNDPALRERLERLLAVSAQADSFFGKSPLENVRADNPGLAPTVRCETPPEAVPAQTIGRYKLLEKIGEGGFGEVWMAEQREPVKRRVALKIIKLGMDSRQVVARFEAERQALAMMDHPNIAKILDAGTTESIVHKPEGRARHSVRSASQLAEHGAQGTDAPYQQSVLSAGRPYFVMELVRGVRITDYCDQNQLPTRERLDLFIKVCQAIQHAHQKGVIHRDIKPSNILVTLHDGVPVPKVIDFGIAKATQQELTDKTVFTQFQQFIGTPAYISPEQAEMSGLDIDTRADIYSLGVLLYELLTGKTPFDGKELLMSGLDEMRRTIREKEPARPSTRLSQELVAVAGVGRVAPRAPSPGEGASTDGAHGVTRPTLPTEEEIRADSRRRLRLKEQIALLRGDLDWIVMKCLEKDRQRRYDTATGLTMDIKRFLNNEPVNARPPSAAYKFQKAWRRNKLAFAAGSAVVAALILGLGFATLSWSREKAARAQADASRREAVLAQASEARQRIEAVEQRRTAESNALRAATNEIAMRRNLYAAEMNMTAQALGELNLRLARELLAHWTNSPVAEDLRDFTWRHLSYQSRGQNNVELPVQGANVGALEFSSDGRLLAVYAQVPRGFEQSPVVVQFWDWSKRRLVVTLTNALFGGWELKEPIAIVGKQNGDIGHYNPMTGEFSRLLNQPHSHFIYSLADETILFVPPVEPSQERVGKYLKLATREITDKYPVPERFLPALQHLETNSVRWRVAPTVGNSLGLRSGIRFGLFRRFEGVDLGGEFAIWDTNLQRIVRRGVLVRTINASAFHERRGLWACGQGGMNPEIFLYDLTSTNEPLHLRGHLSSMGGMAFSPDGSMLASGNSDSTVRLWDTATGKLLRVLRGHEALVFDLAWASDGRTLVSLDSNRRVLIWDIQSPPASPQISGLFGFQYLSGGWVSRAAFSPNGRWLASAMTNGNFTVWDADSLEEYRRFPGRGQVLGFTADSQALDVMESNRVVRWELSARTSQVRLETTNAFTKVAGALSRDGTRLAELNITGRLRLWDLNSGQVAWEDSQRHLPVSLQCVNISDDGQTVVSGEGFSRELHFWNSQSGKSLRTLTPATGGPANGVTALALSRDGRWIAVTAGRVDFKLYEKDHDEPRFTLTGHRQRIRAMAFSPDGKTLATGGSEGVIRLWSVERGQQLAAIPFNELPDPEANDAINALEFSPDGNALAAVNQDGRLRVLRAVSLVDNSPNTAPSPTK